MNAAPPSEVTLPDLSDLSALAAQAFLLEPPTRDEVKGLLRSEAAELIDGLLTRVARGHAALDVAIGDGLAALSRGDRLLRLGYSGLGDYARERLGISARTAQDLARLARALRSRPLLAVAVRSGEVSARKAVTVVPVAVGPAEASWVVRARDETVRALVEAVRLARGEPDAVEEAWDRVEVELPPSARAKVERALELAGKILGPTSPPWQRYEALCMEYLSAHPVELTEDEGEGPVNREAAEWLAAARAALEEETERWSFLERVPPVAAPGAPGEDGETDPLRLDASLRALAAQRDAWDLVLGHLAMLLMWTGLWRDMGFADLDHYCAERLGLARRTVEQRAALARRLYALPVLREAIHAGRLGYEKARLVASVADDTTERAWIARAEQMTCLDLRRALESAEERQLCAAGQVTVRMPRSVAALLGAAFRAVRDAEGRWLSPAACLERLAEHFIGVWEAALKERSTVQRRVRSRDRGLCQFPGCGRAGGHVHHVVPRSRGGSDGERNLVSLCAAHHLHCVHRGWARVRVGAAGALAWELAAWPGEGWSALEGAPRLH